MSMLLFDQDHYTAARWYLGCLILLVAVQSIPRVITSIAHCLKKSQNKPKQHNALTVFLHKCTYLHLPFYPYYQTRLIVFLLLYIVVSLIFSLGHITLDSDVGYVRYGWLAMANISAAIIFALRNSPVYCLLALPFEKTIDFHKWFGIGALVFAWIHGGLYLRQWEEMKATKYMFQERPRLQFGPATASTIAFMVLLAVKPIRRKMWELFWAFHNVCALIVCILAFRHTDYALEFVLPALVLWGLDRVIRFTRGWLRPATVNATADETGQVTRLAIHQKPLWGRAYQAGQYVFINVPRAGLLEWHPASIVSGAPSKKDLETAEGTSNAKDYVLVLRNVGKFTRKLHQAARGDEQLSIRVDGPYGKWDLTTHKYDLLVLIAGGIGATPMISVLLTYLRKMSKESPQMGRVEFIWCVRKEEHIAWFAQELEEAISLGAKVRVHVTESVDVIKADVVDGEERTKVPAAYQVSYERADIVKICQEMKEASPNVDAAVGVCGPATMVRTTRDAVRRCSDRRSLWHLHAEAFDL